MLVLVPELDNMETAAVHVEVNVAFFEIRGYGLPNLDLRMHRFNGFPRSLADALAVDLRQHEQQFQLTLGRLLINTHDDTAHRDAGLHPLLPV